MSLMLFILLQYGLHSALHNKLLYYKYYMLLLFLSCSEDNLECGNFTRTLLSSFKEVISVSNFCGEVAVLLCYSKTCCLQLPAQ